MAFVLDHLVRKSLHLGGFESRYVPTSVGDMHVVQGRGGGSLDPVLLLHGFSAAGIHFASLLRRLRPHVRRLVAPDLPAHGFSAVPPEGANPQTMRAGLYESLLSVLDEPMVVFGNSMGGFAAIRMAQDHPERVRALVLCSPGGAKMDEAQLHEFRKTFHLDTQQAAVEFIDKLFGRPMLMRQVLAWGVKRKLTTQQMRGLIDGVSVADLLEAEDLRSLKMPILLVWGRRDGILPGYQREFFRTHLPAHTQIAEPDGFGHSPYLEAPGPLATEILRFLRALPPAETSS